MFVIINHENHLFNAVLLNLAFILSVVMIVIGDIKNECVQSISIVFKSIVV